MWVVGSEQKQRKRLLFQKKRQKVFSVRRLFVLISSGKRLIAFGIWCTKIAKIMCYLLGKCNNN